LCPVINSQLQYLQLLKTIIRPTLLALLILPLSQLVPAPQLAPKSNVPTPVAVTCTVQELREEEDHLLKKK
jgi:hypothetical protein